MPEHLKLVELKEDAGLDGCYLFNNYRYFELHKIASAFYFALINTDTNTIAGVCHFTETENKIFVSPLRGTFAGPELKENNFEELVILLNRLEEALKEKGARQIIFSSAPFQYNSVFSEQLEKAAIDAGYTIAKDEPAYIMPVDNKNFVEKINRNHQRHLKKCIAEGFSFEQAVTVDEMREVYRVIAANRKHKGYDISMTLEQILQMQDAFKDQVYFFKATHNNSMAASAIGIRINKNVLYVFYWGDLPGYESYSPVIFIADGIYKFAQEHHFKLLDVGSATLHGQPIAGLINFKESLGFTASRKLTYAKTV